MTVRSLTSALLMLVIGVSVASAEEPVPIRFVLSNPPAYQAHAPLIQGKVSAVRSQGGAKVGDCYYHDTYTFTLDDDTAAISVIAPAGPCTTPGAPRVPLAAPVSDGEMVSLRAHILVLVENDPLHPKVMAKALPADILRIEDTTR